MKFKVGDKVRVLGMKEEYGGKLDIGSIHTVSGPGIGGDDTLLVDDNCFYHYHEKYFELVEPVHQPVRLPDGHHIDYSKLGVRSTLTMYDGEPIDYSAAFRDAVALLGQVDPSGVRRLQKLHPNAFKEF